MSNVRIPRRKPLRARVGVFGVGFHAYWPQFDGLLEELLILVSGFIVTMTMLVSMLPIFGTDGLHTLLDLHRYSGLVVVIALALHFYGVAIQKVGLQ